MSLCVAVALAPACAFGADAPRRQADARVLDHAEFLCDNCFFGASDYYYCFAADNKILVAYQKAPVLNWRDKSKNYLTPAHPGWEAWAAPGSTVPVSYDDKHVWVRRPPAGEAKGFGGHFRAVARWFGRSHGREVRLTQSATRDMFHDAQCRAGK
jgi:hypothetical protein